MDVIGLVIGISALLAFLAHLVALWAEIIRMRLSIKRELREDVKLLLDLRDNLDYLSDFNKYTELMDRVQKAIDEKIKSI